MIKEHITKFILPISFDQNEVGEYTSQTDSIKLPKFDGNENETSFNLWERIDDSEISDFFLPHISRFLSHNDKNNFLSRWKMSDDGIDLIFKFNKKYSIFSAVLNKFSEKFSVENVELYLYGSGIGFLIVDCKVLNIARTNQLVDFNYYLKYISDYSCIIKFEIGDAHPRKIEQFSANRDAHQKFYNKPIIPLKIQELHNYTIEDGVVVFQKKILFGDLLKSILNFTFINSDSYSLMLGRQLCVYTYMLTDPLEVKDRFNILFYLRRVVKHSYLPTGTELSYSSQEIINTFENIHFGASLEGSVVLVEDNGNPFFNQFYQRIKSGYFHLFLIAFHSRLALLNYSTQMESILSGEIKNLFVSKVELKKIKNFRYHVMNFYLKSFFVQVTNNTIYERIYSFYNKNLSTDLLFQEIKRKSTELDEMVSIDLDRKNNKLINLITSIGFVFAPLSLISGLLGMNILNAEGNYVDYPQMLFALEWFIIPASSLIIVATFMYLFFTRKK